MCGENGGGGWGADDPASVAFYVDDAISVDVQWDAESARFLDLSRSLASIYDQAMGEGSEAKEPLLSPEKVLVWATQQEVWGTISTQRV